mgnify:CR=1 FL=1
MPRIAANQCASNRTARRDSDWCVGCGLFFVAVGYHRADCTTRPAPCETCKYHLWVHGYHRADCDQSAEVGS